MSIQSEITRLSGNVSAALTAISDAGGAVPSGSNSDDLADLIAQIPNVNYWRNGDVAITDASGVAKLPLNRELPAGDYIMIATTTTTYTGTERLYVSFHSVDGQGGTTMGVGNRIGHAVFYKNSTDSYVFSLTGTAKGAILCAAQSQSGSTGFTATYSDVVILPKAWIATEAVTGVVPTEASQTITPTLGKTGLSSVQINAIPSSYIGSGVKRVQTYSGTGSAHSTAYTATDVQLTVAKSGTYDVSWDAWRTTTSGTSGSKLYIDGTGYGDAVTTWDIGSYGHHVSLSGLSLTAGEVLVVRVRSNNTSNYVYCGNLIIQEV